MLLLLNLTVKSGFPVVSSRNSKEFLEMTGTEYLLSLEILKDFRNRKWS